MGCRPYARHVTKPKPKKKMKQENITRREFEVPLKDAFFYFHLGYPPAKTCPIGENEEAMDEHFEAFCKIYSQLASDQFPGARDEFEKRAAKLNRWIAITKWSIIGLPVAWFLAKVFDDERAKVIHWVTDKIFDEAQIAYIAYWHWAWDEASYAKVEGLDEEVELKIAARLNEADKLGEM